MKIGFPLFPETASTLAPQVDAIYFFGLAIAAFFSLLIASLIFYLGLRYRRTPDNMVGKREKAGIWLEIGWSVIPFAIMMLMFVWGTKVFFTAVRVPSDAIEYYATAKQWMWKFQHPEGNREINHLHVPKGQPIKLIMTSEDVIHSFFVPAFRVKQDVIPGRYTTVWFEADKIGTYNLFCAEYCGAEHSRMIGSVVVMEPRQYENWLAGNSDGKTVLAAGADLFSAKACDTCHRADSAARAPILNGIFGTQRAFLNGGPVIADEDYLRESILDPQKRMVVGYNPIMPTYKGQLSEDELLKLISYIKTLPTTDTAAVGPDDVEPSSAATAGAAP